MIERKKYGILPLSASGKEKYISGATARRGHGFHTRPTCHCHRPEAFYQILFSIFSIAPAQDNGRIADEKLFLIGG